MHSLVEFSDGSIKAQLGVPDMRLPILRALAYPDRLPVPQAPPLDLAATGKLHFGFVDLDRYPLLGMALEAGRIGGTAPAAAAAADEVAVQQFLAGRISFRTIEAVVDSVLSNHTVIADPDLEEILAADESARREAADWIATR